VAASWSLVDSASCDILFLLLLDRLASGEPGSNFGPIRICHPN
jgi:hypothetical protein